MEVHGGAEVWLNFCIHRNLANIQVVSSEYTISFSKLSSF